MNIIDLIEKKKAKQALTEQEVNFFFNEYIKNHTIKDYQASSLLMAIYFNGLNEKEVYYFTKATLESGKTFNFNEVKGIKIDKHSTGGVGDKVSMILAPICVALGLKVCKLSGIGLGHTGGTLDKLASIGINTNLKREQYLKILKKDGMFVISQTPEICPADKEIYALRNSTATIDSLPLIACSVVAKKIAFKTDYVFIDLKVGSGAFCSTISQAKKLAHIMMDLFKKFHHKAVVHLTNMDQPIGTNVGNAIEVQGAIDYLLGKPENVAIKELIDEFVIDILLTTKKASNKKHAQKMINEVIDNKKAYEIFIKWAIDQGADEKTLRSNFFKPKYKYEIKSPNTGYITYKSAKELGLISLELGAGRLTKESSVDYHAGIHLNKSHNDHIKKGEILGILYSSKPIKKELVTRFIDNVKFSTTKFKDIKQIIEVIK